MGYYDTQQVCLNGHQITCMYNSSLAHRQDYCEKCGERTIHECPNCNTPIRGYYHADGVIGLGIKIKVPSHCHQCGEPYPWTERKKKIHRKTKENKNMESISLIEKVCSRFHLVAKQLYKRYKNRPTLKVVDEYDVHDLIHSLLKIFSDDIRTEEWTPSYAGKSSRMDFLLKKECIIIEVKMTRPSLGEKEVGTQLIEDIARYKRHPNCKILLCFVYDPEGHIKHPRGLESDLSRHEEGLEVKVLVVPKGY